jgi:uncharacterized coiled-coil DUF342 family protein
MQHLTYQELREKVTTLEDLLLAEANDRDALARELQRAKSMLGNAVAERDRLLAELDRHKAATDEAVRVASRYAQLGPVTEAHRGASATS